MRAVLSLPLAALLASSACADTAPAPGPGLGVACSFKAGCTVTVGGKVWSTSSVTKAHAGGKWCSAADDSLKPVKLEQTSGSDALGDYSGTRLSWNCAGTPFETAVRVYASEQGDSAVFSQTWPEGATATALGPAKVPGPGGPQEEVISAFPSIAPPAEQGDAGHYMVVWNQMVGGMAEGTQYGVWGPKTATVASGTMAGPMVFWGGALGKTALVYTPVTHAMESNLFWDDSSRTLQSGLLGSITSIPANYTSETMLFVGPRVAAPCAPFAVGINCAVRNWGRTLRKYKGKDTGFPAGGWAADPTLSHLGYYTDNGAYYYYYNTPHGGKPSNFGVDFRAVYEVDAVQRRVPLKYLQLDSYWYFKNGGGLTNWTATPEAFPGGLAKLAKDTGWKFVAHSRYWSPKVVYAKQNGGKFNFILEHSKAIPNDQSFWDYLMASSKAWGMSVYEQDWLHNEWEGLNATLSSPTLSTDWLKQMGEGARKSKVKIQYCMAYGRHTVASAEIEAVNQIRVSDDYATGVKTFDLDLNNANLYVGASSMFAAALGLAPSKDVFWSNSSQRYPIKASARYPLAHEPFPELQTAVALLSAGPVGPGDRIGAANQTLLASTCRPDGLLLKPSYPATALDAVLEQRASGGWRPHDVPFIVTGELNVAYSTITGGSALTYAAIIGIDLPKDVTLTAEQLGFGMAKMVFFAARAGYVNATVATSITLPKCRKENFQLFYATTVQPPTRATLLGEPEKIVPHSPTRFGNGSYDAADTYSVDVAGVAGEKVSVAFFYARDNTVLVASCAFKSDGALQAKAVGAMPHKVCCGGDCA